MSINRGMPREDVEYLGNGILLSIKGSKIGSFVEPGVDLETVILSEVSQKEKTKIIY